APKIAGTLVLEKVFAGAHLDFLMLCSSVSSLLPPAGQVDYAAANAFLDAFVSSKPDLPAIAVNWGLWKDVGMGDRASTAVHPLPVPAEETRHVRLSLKRDASSFQFSVYSQEADWRECATGLISRTASKPPKKCDLASLAAKCSRKELIFDAEHRTFQEKFLNFGPRWRNLKSIRLGEG